jgi:uncharacterized protein YndB with AHSA1/START domain
VRVTRQQGERLRRHSTRFHARARPGTTLHIMADDTYTVQRSMTVDAPPERIYEQIADFHNWRNWSPWEDVDPALKRTYSGANAGVGAIYGWSGNRKAGQGRMQITNATQPSRLQIDLMFEKPWKARNDTVFTIEPQGAGSRVTWSMTGRKTLMTKVMGVFKSMDSLLGPDFEKGLSRLKVVSEKST